jgi:hypothetical protein
MFYLLLGWFSVVNIYFSVNLKIQEDDKLTYQDYGVLQKKVVIKKSDEF